MKLYKTQLKLLLTNKDLYILLGSFVLFLGYILYVSGFYNDINYQVVNSNDLFHEYLLDSLSFMKFSIVLYGIYFVTLSRNLHYMDGLLLSRSKRKSVIISRLFVVGTYTFLVQSILFVLFLLVGHFLTPIMKDYNYIELFLSIQLFGIFYLLISYIVMLMLKVPYAPIFVLFFYFVGSIFSPYYVSHEEVSVMERLVSFIVNDLVVFQDFSIAPLYGNLHLIVINLVLILYVIYIYNENDIIIL